MMGYKRCLICKCEIPCGGSNEAQREGWSKLVMRSDQFKYSGLVCPTCSLEKLKPLYFEEGRTWEV